MTCKAIFLPINFLIKQRRVRFLFLVVVTVLIVIKIESLNTRQNFHPLSDTLSRYIQSERDELHIAREIGSTSFDNTTNIHITERVFLASEENRVFILGAVAKNSTPSAKWDQYALYGQWNYDHVNLNMSSLRCCFKYDDGSVVEQVPAHFNVRDYDQYTHTVLQADLLLWHITCNKPPVDPSLVSIARYSACSNTNVNYMKPFFAVKQPDGHIVITTKFAYGQMDPEQVVSYLEAVKYLGVDKVITYVHANLAPKVKEVLRYYAYIGLVDYYTIQLADDGRTSHAFPPLTGQYHSDEWLLKRDALERSIGSTYFGIFDMDEFLIPSGGRSYKELLGNLRHLQPGAAVFFFKNMHFLTEGRLSDLQCSPNCSMFNRYVMTSPFKFNHIHRKLILITSRVQTQTIQNHGVVPIKGFVRFLCPEEEAYTRHYGSCRRKFNARICNNKTAWVRDNSMVDWAEKTIKTSIQSTMTLLNLT